MLHSLNYSTIGAGQQRCSIQSINESQLNEVFSASKLFDVQNQICLGMETFGQQSGASANQFDYIYSYSNGAIQTPPQFDNLLYIPTINSHLSQQTGETKSFGTDQQQFTFEKSIQFYEKKFNPLIKIEENSESFPVVIGDNFQKALNFDSLQQDSLLFQTSSTQFQRNDTNFYSSLKETKFNPNTGSHQSLSKFKNLGTSLINDQYSSVTNITTDTFPNTKAIFSSVLFTDTSENLALTHYQTPNKMKKKDKLDTRDHIDLLFDLKRQQISRKYVELSQYFISYDGGCEYRGLMAGSKREGFGFFLFSNKFRYQGFWLNDQIHGIGILRDQNGQKIYQGEWQNNNFDGLGRLFNIIKDENSKFFIKKALGESSAVKPLEHIDPIFYFDFDNGTDLWVCFEGQFVTGQKHGVGITYFKDDYKFFGNFKNGKFDGQGTLIFPEQSRRVIGMWKNNKLISMI